MSEFMFEFDSGVSLVENYIRHANNLKDSAIALHGLMERSTVNPNGRMGSEEAIDRQANLMLAAARAVETLGKVLK